jgi:hypothetical protein
MDNDRSDEEDEFFFESSHLALRNNSDYLKLIKHLTVLCAQRIQIQNDIEQLSTSKRKALENPPAFIEDLKNDQLNLPQPVIITEANYCKIVLLLFDI